MRLEGRMRLGYFPLHQMEAQRMRRFLHFPNLPASALDPCAGTGTALVAITENSCSRRYGIELDSHRALEARTTLDEVIPGNAFDAKAPVESFSLLYLNPPYDFEVGEGKNQRMEKLFLEEFFRWLKPGGVLALVIPFDRIYECRNILSPHFKDKAIYRLTEPEPGATSELYLTIEPESAGYVVLGPTLRMLETIHSRLPVTFAYTLLGSLNRWVRVYDWRDALERVDRLREWYEVDPPETPEEVQLPDIESSIPHCMKRRPLSPKTLGRIGPAIKDTTARHLMENVLDIERAAARVVRPVIDEDTGAMLADCGEALPALLAVFEKHDAIEGQFDEESQGMLEVTPEPNLIIRLNGEDVESVRDAFDRLAACCETLACARRLIKMMPGNERPD